MVNGERTLGGAPATSDGIHVDANGRFRVENKDARKAVLVFAFQRKPELLAVVADMIHSGELNDRLAQENESATCEDDCEAA
jgi:hypothetical protein